MSGQGNFEKQANQYRSEQAEKPTSTEAPKTSGTQHHPAEVNNMSGWATILAPLAKILAPWAPDWLRSWIGNRLANEANNSGTQNIQGDNGKQANNSGTQHQPKIAFSQRAPAPAPAQMPTTAPAPAPAPTSGTQNIQGKYGEQANNSGTQYQPEIEF